ncbi:Hypothetical protein TES1_1144 [Thermococcus paralvinellae]|uniref:S-layer protein outer domain-containing protein n=1 Tax=Thermococcus paralvinellae TaxID=582419 RepID=W0I7Z1_9EURY|nr:Hypothetical protein TES1_1144 [Thermococcus paralvinellae]
MKKASLILCFLLLVSQTPLIKAEEQPQVVVEINPNLELFAVVYILAFNGSDDFIIAPKNYIKDVLTYFAPYKEHPAVYLMRETFPRDLPWHLRDTSIRRWSDQLFRMRYLGNESDELLSGLLKELVHFAKESDFIHFYKLHEGDYEQAINQSKKALKPEYILKLDSLFNKSYQEYKVELSYSLAIREHAAILDNTAYYIGHAVHISSTPQANFYYAWIGIHEFTHTFVDPIIYKHAQELLSVDYYLKAAKNEWAYATYDGHFYTNYGYIEENLVEAVANYIILSDYPAFSKWRILQDAAVGYPLVGDFLVDIEKMNKTLDIYISQLPERMRKLATPNNVTKYFWERTPITGFLALDRSYKMGEIIIVYGTQNPDRIGVEYDKQTAFQLKKMLENSVAWGKYSIKPIITVKSDKELTKDDLKQNLILIGGPVANEIAKRISPALPLNFAFNEKRWEIKKNLSNIQEFYAFQFFNGSIAQISANSIVPYAYPLQIFEVIRNPWNRNNFIMVLAGIDRYCTRRIAREMLVEKPISYLIESGDYVESGFYIQFYLEG